MDPRRVPIMPEPITADCLADVRGIQHGFFTRKGGVSEGIYAALNCGAGSRDDRERVMENRARVSRHLGAAEAALITCHQVHSAEAIVVREAWGPGHAPKADGLVTAERGIVLGALAADCAPVLFCDPEARVIGAAHAGWKGALTGVLEATIAAMARIGARPSRIRAALGPCIGPEAYEVGPEFEARFLMADDGNARFFRRPGGAERPFFDLPGYVLARLSEAGLDTVESATACSYGDPVRFFSFRRATHRGETDYGRQVSAIVLL
jgi:YfiH family protein